MAPRNIAHVEVVCGGNIGQPMASTLFCARNEEEARSVVRGSDLMSPGVNHVLVLALRMGVRDQSGGSQPAPCYFLLCLPFCGTFPLAEAFPLRYSLGWEVHHFRWMARVEPVRNHSVQRFPGDVRAPSFARLDLSLGPRGFFVRLSTRVF